MSEAPDGEMPKALAEAPNGSRANQDRHLLSLGRSREIANANQVTCGEM